MKKMRLTNKEFSETNKIFIQACEKVNLPNHKTVVKKRGMKPVVTDTSGVTSLVRQASKWRRKKGRAYKGEKK